MSDEKRTPEGAGTANSDAATAVTPTQRDHQTRRNRRVLGPGDWTEEELEKLRSMKVPDEYAYVNAELEGWEP